MSNFNSYSGDESLKLLAGIDITRTKETHWHKNRELTCYFPNSGYLYGHYIFHFSKFIIHFEFFFVLLAFSLTLCLLFYELLGQQKVPSRYAIPIQRT